VFPTDALMISSKAKNPAAARAFVEFAAKDTQSRLFAKTLGNQSVRDYGRALDKKIGAKALDANHQFVGPFASSNRLVVSGQAKWPNTDPSTALATGVQGLLTGQLKVAQVLKAADDAWPK
jgi:raffinose/stachyose/melibiose transport system substrate-binding protein